MANKSEIIDEINEKLFYCECLISPLGIDYYPLKSVIRSAITVADATKYDIIGNHDE